MRPKSRLSSSKKWLFQTSASDSAPFLLLMRLHEVGAGRILEAADGIVHFDAAPVAHHFKAVDVGVFVVAVHAGDKRADRATGELQAEGRGRELPRFARDRKRGRRC